MTSILQDWVAASSHSVRLPNDEVHIWRFSLDASGDERARLRATLSEQEVQRADSIGIEANRRRFEVGHGRLRHVTGKYLGLAPHAVEFGTHPRGKPFIVASQNPDRIQHNFSHTGELALVAITLARAIGVDVEAHRDDVDMELIARRQFAPGEQARLVSLPGAQRTAAFYRCWTRKEAYLKALGDGIAGGLQGFEVSFLDSEPPALLRTKEGPAECKRWTVLPIDVEPGLSAACVVEGAVGNVIRWKLA